MKPIFQAILFLFAPVLQAQVYSYTNDVGGAPNFVASNCTATNLTRVNGAHLPTFPCGSGFSSDKLTQNATYSESNTAVEFTLTPVGSNALSLTSITAKLRRSPTYGANLARFAYRIGSSGGFTDQGIDIPPNNSASCGVTTQYTWVFSSTLSVPKTSSITFRVYFFDASGQQGTAQILDMSVVGSVLPVELMRFEANSVNEQVVLAWETASERDNAFFEIERSGAGLQFEAIGCVEGAGTSSVRRSYVFTDEAPLPGLNYYRLKQVDNDGRVGFGPVVEIDLGMRNIQIYPVPFSSFLMISQSASEGFSGKWEILNVNGVVIKSGELGAFDTTTKINMLDVAPGMYSIKWKVGSHEFYKILVK